MPQIFLIIAVLLLPFGTGLAREAQPTQVMELLKTTKSWDGAPLPPYGKGQPEVTIARIIIQPGQALPMHKHPMINVGFLLGGELTVITKDNKTLYLKAGEAFAEVVNQWHYGKNEGKVPVDLIVFYAGTAGTPITIKK